MKIHLIGKSVLFSLATCFFFSAHAEITYKVDKTKKNAPIIIKFSGRLIDNISLREHKDSLDSFLPKLAVKTVIDNARSGLCLKAKDGKLYNLKFESSETIWSTMTKMKNTATISISGHAQKLADSLLILDFAFDVK